MRLVAPSSATLRIRLGRLSPKRPNPLVFLGAVLLLLTPAALPAARFADLESDTTTAGYLATLLINEVPFPGERGYVSEEDSKSAMLAILWVLHGRLASVPAPYTQWQVAGVKTNQIADIITGDGERRQCEGFFRDASGRPVCTPRVIERRSYLLSIANKGNVAGRFSRLLNFAQGLSSAYVASGITGADRFALLRNVGLIEVTGGAFSWMTDKDYYSPGGNFVRIPDADSGSLGGNRFFTLRKSPK